MSTIPTVNEQIPVGCHLLRLFERLRVVEARLTELERKRGRKVSARAMAEDHLDARDRARDRRKPERDEEEASMVKLEPLSGRRAGGDKRRRCPPAADR